MHWGARCVSTWLLVAIASLTPSCLQGDCETGTARYGDTCVLVDPFDKTPPQITVDPPLYTRQVGTVRLTSDKPATIYYTLDGTPTSTSSPSGLDQVVIPNVPDNTQLRYFAIDLAGNQSAEQVRVWIIDRDGPLRPDFQLVVADSTRTISWTAASDPRPGGVLVARVDGRMTSEPVSGQAYSIGDAIAPGLTVVAMSGPTVTTSTFSETIATTPGLVRYVAWGFDDLLNYSQPNGGYTLVPLTPQTANLTVDAAAGTVSVTTPASNLTLMGTATLSGSTLTVKLALRNDTTRVLFAPKIALSNTLSGVTWSNSDGTTTDALPFRSYGAAILPGSTDTKSWVFDNASSNTTLMLSLDIRDGRVFTASNSDRTSAGQIIDSETGNALLTLATGPTGQGGNAMTRRGGITPDGRLVVGARTAGTVSSFDLVSGHRVLTTTLAPEKSHVPQVILDNSGTAAYALIAQGHPEIINNNSNTTGTPTQLVRLDTATLTDFGRLDLGNSANRCIDLSADGKTLVVATGDTADGVIVVDVPTFQIATRIVAEFRAQCALFAPDGSIVLVGEQVAVYDRTGVLGVHYPTPGSMGGKVLRAAFLSPTQLWIGRRNEVLHIDLGTGMSQEFTMMPGQMLEVFDANVYVRNGNAIQRLDNTGTVAATLNGFSSLKGHWLGRSPF